MSWIMVVCTHAEAPRPPASELPGIAEDAEGRESSSGRVRIPARRYRRALAEHLCERAAALRGHGESGVRSTCSPQSVLRAASMARERLDVYLVERFWD